MLAVGRTWDELSALVPDLADRGIDLSAATSGQTVVGGPPGAVAELASLLRGHRIACRELDTTHAFHTRMLEPAADELTRWIAEHITLNAPTLPYVSNVTGELATGELVTDPGYWAKHMCQPVRFADALATVLGRTDHALIELGPGMRWERWRALTRPATAPDGRSSSPRCPRRRTTRQATGPWPASWPRRG